MKARGDKPLMGLVAREEEPAYSFEWGMSRWFVSPAKQGALTTFGEAWIPAGAGHGRHNHPDSEEILYVLSGRGDQMVNDDPSFELSPGDVVYIPVGIYHATFAVGWEPLRLIVVHAPGGAEEAIKGAPGFRSVPADATQLWQRSDIVPRGSLIRGS